MRSSLRTAVVVLAGLAPTPEIDALIAELYQTPPDIVAEVRATIAPGAK